MKIQLSQKQVEHLIAWCRVYQPTDETAESERDAQYYNDIGESRARQLDAHLAKTKTKVPR